MLWNAKGGIAPSSGFVVNPLLSKLATTRVNRDNPQDYTSAILARVRTCRLFPLV